jgi:hypothetical protein
LDRWRTRQELVERLIGQLEREFAAFPLPSAGST